MHRSISESDWKIFRQIREIALERFCERVLAQIGYEASDKQKTSHERYLAVYKTIHERDEEVAAMFNDPRRSVAWEQLAFIRSRKLLTDEEMARFSEETLKVVRLYLRK